MIGFLLAVACTDKFDIDTGLILADIDLDGDGALDVFIPHGKGWTAFQGSSTGLVGEVLDSARMEQDFCVSFGLLDAAFTRDPDGVLQWGLSMADSPECPYYDHPFRGRVPLFRGWEWSRRELTEAETWLAPEPDWNDVNTYLITGTRPLEFFQVGG